MSSIKSHDGLFLKSYRSGKRECDGSYGAMGLTGWCGTTCCYQKGSKLRGGLSLKLLEEW